MGRMTKPGLIQKGPFEVKGAVCPLLCFVVFVLLLLSTLTQQHLALDQMRVVDGGHNNVVSLNTELNKSLKLPEHL